ncbi:hypothetical protein BGZ73_006717 [Actinomortierella ambigua]|nr:hypothetical protein BGZ73_006717 [Actinomortierella ambigua]
MAKKATTSGRVEKTSSAPKRALGTTALPAARIKRIIKEDKDINMVSNDAVFLISLATELFLESFMSKAYGLAKMEKRKTVFYKDLDVIPKTMPLSEALERQRKAKEQEENGVLDDTADQGANGQGESDDDGSNQVETPAEEDDDDNSLTGSGTGDLSGSGPEDMDED